MQAVWSFRLTQTFASSDGVQRGSTEVPNAAQAETSFRETALVARRRWTPGLAVGLRLPWVDIHAEEKGQADENLSGIGDLALFAEQQLADGLHLVLGCKLPTGKEKKSPRPGVIPPSLLQVGTGTFDPLLGLRWHAASGRAVWSAGALWQRPLGESDAELAPAKLQMQFAGGWLATEELAFSLGVEALFRDHDQLMGNELASTGSSIWSLNPGLTWSLSENTSLDLLARLPIETQVNRTQVVPGPLFLFGINYRF